MTDVAPVQTEELAARWLDAEDRSHAEPANAGVAQEAAELGEAYERAVRGASVEDLRLAWEAARRTQALEEIGGSTWANARRVSELLRTEYEATRDGSREP
jgi:hypothetical protein